MQKSTIIGGIALILLVVGMAFLAGSKPREGEPASVGLPIKGYSEHAPYYDIDADYPARTPLAESAGAAADKAARADMAGFIKDSVYQFKADGDFSNLTPKDIQMMGFDQGRKETLKITYEQASSSNTLSYMYTIYMDTLGAHGNTTYKTFTFNVKTGARVMLADLFSGSYLQTLSSLAREKLPKALGEFAVTSDIQAGTTPEEQNFENFYLDGADFVLLFPPYQVAAYAAGPQTLRIPRTELSSILKPEYR